MKITELLGHKCNTVITETDNYDYQSENKQDVMIPPLQQKIELMKKAVDVDNHYDDEDDEHDSDQTINLTINVPKGHSDSKLELTINSPTNSLSRIKKLAGVDAATISNCSDDILDE
jgi:hypothetical protein